MIPIVLTLFLAALQPNIAAASGSFRLCTYGTTSTSKCKALLRAANSQPVELNLVCVGLESRDDCMNSVSIGRSDLVVLSQHDYQMARRIGLKPILYARESKSSHYIAVAPANITVAELNDAQLQLDTRDHGAFHSAVAFNNARGRNVCPDSYFVSDKPTIRILNSAKYDFAEANNDILICLTGGSAAVTKDNIETCNFDTGLQRAIFSSNTFSIRRLDEVRGVFIKLLQYFKGDRARTFNFFSTFHRVNDVIFKNDTVGFDLSPTFYNGVDESLFNKLHCGRPDLEHSEVQLGDDLVETGIFDQIRKYAPFVLPFLG
ncbi:uncharacterized protein LOC115626582 [Scaptodrosophila lebanonensis]|uniref:Uncharacterized protein LOC115626582 n=1 Tax=Drosophila lebanonensis TaxID=7225 RepID=A0A6J2TRT2_DROLE|nr:uncharacterized protein LOC115626582 [Scaptodrosophila lebanonensis]